MPLTRRAAEKTPPPCSDEDDIESPTQQHVHNVSDDDDNDQPANDAHHHHNNNNNNNNNNQNHNLNNHTDPRNEPMHIEITNVIPASNDSDDLHHPTQPLSRRPSTSRPSSSSSSARNNNAPELAQIHEEPIPGSRPRPRRPTRSAPSAKPVDRQNDPHALHIPRIASASQPPSKTTKQRRLIQLHEKSAHSYNLFQVHRDRANRTRGRAASHQHAPLSEVVDLVAGDSRPASAANAPAAANPPVSTASAMSAAAATAAAAAAAATTSAATATTTATTTATANPAAAAKTSANADTAAANATHPTDSTGAAPATGSNTPRRRSTRLRSQGALCDGGRVVAGGSALSSAARRASAPAASRDDDDKVEEVQDELENLQRDTTYTGPVTPLFAYPEGKRGSIRVTEEERVRLRDRLYLNDSLIDFYVKYLETTRTEVDTDGHLQTVGRKFFSSFFFGRLRQARPIDYSGVKSWTKTIDLFQQKYVFVPICDSSHWSLIIIANLDTLAKRLAEKRQSDKPVSKPGPTTPKMIYLDSLHPPRGNELCNFVFHYLSEEWLAKMCKKDNPTPERKSHMYKEIKAAFKVHKPDIPVQNNEHDCGLYLLMCMQMFLDNSKGFRINLIRGGDMCEAFVASDIEHLRSEILDIINMFAEEAERRKPQSKRPITKDRLNTDKATTTTPAQSRKPAQQHQNAQKPDPSTTVAKRPASPQKDQNARASDTQPTFQSASSHRNAQQPASMQTSHPHEERPQAPPERLSTPIAPPPTSLEIEQLHAQHIQNPYPAAGPLPHIVSNVAGMITDEVLQITAAERRASAQARPLRSGSRLVARTGAGARRSARGDSLVKGIMSTVRQLGSLSPHSTRMFVPGLPHTDGGVCGDEEQKDRPAVHTLPDTSIHDAAASIKAEAAAAAAAAAARSATANHDALASHELFAQGEAEIEAGCDVAMVQAGTDAQAEVSPRTARRQRYYGGVGVMDAGAEDGDTDMKDQFEVQASPVRHGDQYTELLDEDPRRINLHGLADVDGDGDADGDAMEDEPPLTQHEDVEEEEEPVQHGVEEESHDGADKDDGEGEEENGEPMETVDCTGSGFSFGGGVQNGCESPGRGIEVDDEEEM